MKREEFNIMSDIKIIAELKANLLCIIAEFYKLMTRGSNVAQEAILDCISGAIIVLYVLGDRLGYSYVSVDELIKKKLKIGVMDGDTLEKNGKNLSRLSTHLTDRE
jgi:hypothetical protein